MIQGKTNTEANYRAVMLDSSSSLKDFSMDRRKYYKKYILNEPMNEKETGAANMGRLVETILMEPELFDEKFYLSSCENVPTGLMLDFVEALYKATTNATNENTGKVNKDFETLSKEAYEMSGFKLKYESVMNKFIDSDAQMYYDEIRKVRANNLTVVNNMEINIANKIVNTLKSSPVTGPIFSLVNSERYTVFNQLQVEDYTMMGHQFKSMMDLVVIDHHEKTIQVYDLKCTWNVENFFEEYYLYRRAYIQAYLYKKAAESLADDVNAEYYNYQVLHPRFIVCDSGDYYAPLIYKLSDEDMIDANIGFEYKGRRYPGVKELVASLKWAITTNTWNISVENFVENGVVKLRNR
jgi:hypothetical protein